MALGDPYATLAELKDYLKIPVDKTSLDEALGDALASATAEIERHTNRQFNKTTSATARVFEPTSWRGADVDDFWTVSGLVVETDSGGVGTFDTTWTSADYELLPFNGIVNGQPGWPFNELRSVGGLFFPKYGKQPFRRKAVLRVTAQWGWDAVPAPVHQSCLIMAAETFRIKDAPFGVAGSDQFGTVLRVRDNKMACTKLHRYVRNPVLVG
jgi:hypothetical protein